MNKTISYILSIFFIAFVSSGCSTVNVKQIPSKEDLSGKGILIVTSYDTKGDMDDNKPTSHQMIIAVYDGNPDDDDSKIIQEVEGPVLRVENLLPGKYYLRIKGWKDEKGKIDSSKSRDMKFKIEPGKITEINLVITDYLKSTILVGGVAVGTAALLAVGFSVVLVLALIAAI
ncbi:MAG TPA: hypothetical protein VIS94_10335 [Desulfomonilia bacterium]